ncbi:MAG: thioredoxin domain-containing protein [Thermoanaerobaculia bacterium]
MTEQRHTNRLVHETSPYLLQHAHNPVDWYPWGDEAFAKARAEDKPVFLSVGYSACHWCHVMERESFENEEIAALLNRDFVSVKVDREERPDIDSIYMQAVQLMTGRGGWPMSMFLTPEGAPFFGGTYFPPDDVRGMPGFPRVLTHVADVFHNRRDDVTEATREMQRALDGIMEIAPSDRASSREELTRAAGAISAGFDPRNGGFGGAPKFPSPMTLDFLMRVAHDREDETTREMVATTLRKMAMGGIYDQVGGGFHRYSVDAQWLVPHFEKMLYDNALLARTYTRYWQWKRDPFAARIAKEVLGFVQREMTSPAGGFYSTLDADSEDEEGRFYVWDRSEIMEALGQDEGHVFCTLYGVTERGNFEGKNILHLPQKPEEVASQLGLSLESLIDIAARGKCHLYGKRAERIRPGRDEKVLAGWNGWMLTAFAEGALAFHSESMLEVARKNADFLIGTMMRDDRLRRSWKDGSARIEGLLEDHAGVASGLIATFEASQERQYLDAARSLASQIVAHFRDDASGAFFDTPATYEKLLTRPRDPFDNATPSGNAMAIDILFRLARYFGEPELARIAERAVRALLPTALRFPSGFGYLLGTTWDSLGKTMEIAITGPAGTADYDRLMNVAGEAWLPNRILATSRAGDLPILEGKPAGETAAWVCEEYRCLEPTGDPEKLKELLG